jgi:hypothetical protein
MQTLAAGLALFIVASAPLPGQWLKYKTPGIPRTADGKPDLTASAPKMPDGKPDLSGIWEANTGGYGVNVAADLKPGEVKEWADALYRQRSENLSIDYPGFRCLPNIGPILSFDTSKILQTPDVIAFLSYDGTYRQILMDGRGLPVDPNPTWQGYSVGHWDGDTLMVESAGFNDKTWLDYGGHPHTEQLRVTERFHRKDFGHIDLSVTFDDPKAYTRPWTISMVMDLVPDTELLEYVCNENERDVQHFVVTEEDRKKTRGVKVDAAILSKYAGLYQFVDDQGRPVDREGKPAAPDAKPELYTVLLTDNQLQLQPPGSTSGFPLTPESDTKFTLAGQLLEFVTDGQGAVTHLVLHIVEGDRKAIRKSNLQ